MKMLEKVDHREAESAWLPNGDYGWKVGEQHEPRSTDDYASRAKRITVYYENGQMAGVPWLRIEHHDGRVTHVDAAHYEVTFAAEVP